MKICLVTYLRLDLHPLQTKRKQHVLFLSGLDSVEPAAGPAVASHKRLPPTLFGKQFLKNMIRKRWKNKTVLRNKPRFSIFRVLLLGWSRLERPPFCRMFGIHAWVLKQTCQRVFTSFMKTLQGRSSNPHVRIQPLHQLFQHSSERCLGNEFFWLRNSNWIRLPSFL